MCSYLPLRARTSSRNAIDKLRKDNAALKEELLLENKFSVQPTCASAAALLAHLQEQSDALTRQAQYPLLYHISMSHKKLVLQPTTESLALLTSCTCLSWRSEQISVERTRAGELDERMGALQQKLDKLRASTGGLTAARQQEVAVRRTKPYTPLFGTR